jgi:hypothetical protein
VEADAVVAVRLQGHVEADTRGSTASYYKLQAKQKPEVQILLHAAHRLLLLAS